jgi:hypothetical protein
VTGHTTTHAHIMNALGGVNLCRRDKAPDELALLTGALLHRAPRAGCLTGCRAGTLVPTQSTLPDFHAQHTPDSLPL